MKITGRSDTITLAISVIVQVDVHVVVTCILPLLMIAMNSFIEVKTVGNLVA